MVLQHITNMEEVFTVLMEKRISRMMKKNLLRVMSKKEKSNHELRRTLQDN